ncbi:hypothetical protein B9479_006083 [Cryptococcus floricola]|uniref:3-dehydrosphinganine reductase n=1 Tax=Cryptococcus floricola TaxID=2591691 RepID=A0A5D3ASR5_9TREE|nr:hypothetical protein B9479_006083 [Cryptococcus floricola]
MGYTIPSITSLLAQYPTSLALLVLLSSILFTMPLWNSKKPAYKPEGKHCYITGGSQGLGKALAESLVKQGAHVTIVARDAKRGEGVVEELKSLAKPTQIIQFISADLSSPTDSDQALLAACIPHKGLAPDYIFLCAGFSQPKYFVENTKAEIKWGMDGVYLVSAYTAHSAISLMVSQNRTGSLTFVSSFLGYTSFAGYSTYSPAKYALRGLADALRSEMLLHDIDVHIFHPCGILSPGYEKEMMTKPDVTRKIEDGDKPITPEESVAALESGLRKGYYQITDNLVADFVRLRANGGVPSNNFFGIPIWRMFADSIVRGGRKTIHEDYAKRGFFQGAAPVAE